MQNTHQAGTEKDRDVSAKPPAQSGHRPRRRWGRVLVSTLMLGYAACLGALVTFESRLVFPGAYRVFADPGPDLATRPWEYASGDGSPITGRLIERPGATRTVLYLHGNGTKAVMQDDLIAQISRCLNANVLAAEYRGFEHSDVTPTEANLADDSVAAFDALAGRYGLRPEAVIVYGQSLGGGCAASVAARRDVKLLVLERTFDSVANVAAGRFPVFPVRLLVRNQFDSVSKLRNYSGHVVQIHGTSDEIIPIESGRRLYESLDCDSKVFLEVPGLWHTDPMPDEILSHVDARFSDLNPL